MNRTIDLHGGSDENCKPQQKRTIEVNVLQTLGNDFQVSGSVFYSRFSNLIQTADPDQSYAGLYLGWPVTCIDFTVNEGQDAGRLRHGRRERAEFSLRVH